MENINYSKFSEEKKVETPVVEEPVIKDEEIVEPKIKEDEIVEPKIKEDENIDEPTISIGKVANCKKLNVRMEPLKNAAVATVIECGETVLIVEEESTDDFYAVQVADVEGFCMKEFITVE